MQRPRRKWREGRYEPNRGIGQDDAALNKVVRSRQGRTAFAGVPRSGRGAVDHVINPALAPTILLFSDDVSLFHLTARAAGKEWKLERCDDLRNCREWLVRPEVGLVIVDDEAIEEHLRGWLLERVRIYVPRAPFLYVAGRHSNEGEKRARAYAAGYYTSKPVEAGSLERVLASFISQAQALNQKPSNWPSMLGAKRK